MTAHQSQHAGVSDGMNIFCPECGEVLQSATALLEAQREEIVVLQNEVSKKAVQISRLKGERLGKLRERKNYKKARSVLEHWKATCMPTAREIESGDRLVNAMARVDGGFPEEELKRACDGYALKPYVVNYKRSNVGRADEWVADAEFIFRNPQNVQKGLALLEAHEAMQRALGDDDNVPATATPPQQQQLPVSSAGGFGDRIAAYAYDLGWAVFPCRPDDGTLVNGKPAAKMPATAHGFQDATRDVDRIRKCWSQRPDLNVAIATGQPSGVVVLDVDVYKDGGASLAELEKRYGSLPSTLSAVTPRGGQHYFFRWPGTQIPLARDLVPGIDFRGDGGYVLIAPSRVGGKAYEWDERMEPAEMPEWLLNGLRSKAQQVKSVDYWIDLAKGVSEGQRNSRLTELVGLMVGRGLPDDLVATLALAVNKQFRPPLMDREVGTIVRSIVTRHRRQAASTSS